MQKIATRIFVCSSIAFGIIGILIVLLLPDGLASNSILGLILTRLLFTTVFIILPSFALSVAGKYLNGTNK
jgi:hypothetical protein